MPTDSLSTAPGATNGPAGERMSGQRRVLTGVLTLVWGDPPAAAAGPERAQREAFLTDSTGRSVGVLVSDSLARALGGLRAFDRRRVRVVGTVEPGPRGRIRAVTIEREVAGAP